MINFKKFDKKKLFKSKFKIALVILLLTGLIAALLFLGVKRSSTQKAETKKENTGQEIKIKTTKEVMTTDELWKDAIETKIKDQNEAQGKLIDSKISEIKSQLDQQNHKEHGLTH